MKRASALVVFVLLLGFPGWSEAMADTPKLSVALTPTSIRLGTEVVVDVVCRIGDRDCTDAEIQALDDCQNVPEASPCTDTLLKIPFEFKEGFDPSALIVAPLYKRLARLWRDIVLAAEARREKATGRVILLVHPAVPFRILMEVIYTAGKVGIKGYGGLSEFHFQTHPPGIEAQPVERVFTLPKFSDRDGPEKARVAILVAKERLVLKLWLPGAAGSQREEIEFGNKKQRICGRKGFTEDYDYTGLYTKLVELRRASWWSPDVDLNVGAENPIPWRVLSRVYDTVTSHREKDSYTELCEFLDAPIRTETGTDSTGKTTEVPVPLFPNVVLLML